MKNTQVKIEDLFGDSISKDSVSPKQITKHTNLIATIM